MPVLAAPFAPPVQQAADAWQPFGVFWHGCDGSLWDMVDPDSGVVLSPDGIRGLGMPTFDRRTTVSADGAGAQYRGSRTQERTWLWALFLYGDSTLAWLQRFRAFMASMRPDSTGTFELVAPDGTSRFLDLRFVDDNGQAYGQDPAQAGWSVHAVNMVADDNPYWYGPQIVKSFGPPDTSQFFLTTGGVVHIAAGDTVSTASVPNPGDVDAWPIWTVTGSHTGAVLAAGAGSVVVPAMADGETWVIDTNPARMTAIDQDGADQSSQLQWNPAPIPRGSEVALSLTLSAPDQEASITCAIRPQFFRAF